MVTLRAIFLWRRWADDKSDTGTVEFVLSLLEVARALARCARLRPLAVGSCGACFGESFQ